MLMISVVQVREVLVRPHLTSRQTLGLVKEPQACLTLSGPRLKSCQVAKYAVGLLCSQTAVLHTPLCGNANFNRVEVSRCICDESSTHALVQSQVSCVLLISTCRQFVLH